MSEPQRAKLVDALVAQLRHYADSPEDGRTATLSALAVTLVDLREQFEHGGRPDRTGKSAGYRAAYGEAFARAALPEDTERTVKTTVRYHVNSELHRRLSPESLADYGINPRPIRERAAARHTVDSAAVLLATVAVRADEPLGEARRMLSYCDRMLRIVSPDNLAMPELRADAIDALRNIRDHADKLLDYIGGG